MTNKKQTLENIYPKGTRVEIVSLCNNEPNYPTGSKGTVLFVDDALQVHVKWDNGGSIALLPYEGDVFKVLKDL